MSTSMAKRRNKPSVLWFALAVGLVLVSLVVRSASRQSASGIGPSAQAGAGQVSLQKSLTSTYTASELKKGVYVGSETCLGCHEALSTWKDTKHALSIRKPTARYSLVPGKGVVADYDRNGVDDFIQGLDFNTISSVFDPYKPDAPVLSVDSGQYFITLGHVKMPVVFVLGGTGDWRERYGVRIPSTDSPTGYSDDVYTSPVQFNEDSKTYFAYKIGNWYGETKRPWSHRERPVPPFPNQSNSRHSARTAWGAISPVSAALAKRRRVNGCCGPTQRFASTPITLAISTTTVTARRTS
jgi:hypothetical protein